MKYKIAQEDTYNMDEKGFAIGAAGRVKIICDKADLKEFMIQDGNREWVSLIECIFMNERILDFYIIFKGKRQLKSWFNHLVDEIITTSEKR